MASQVDICNLALRDIGANPISSIEETSKEAKVCADYWSLLLDELLEEHPWDFAKKWVALALDGTHTFIDSRYDYAYTKPNDYIRMCDTELNFNYEVRGQLIVTNEEGAEIEYIWRITDTTKFPPYFIRALVSLLRSRICGPLAKKGSKTKDWKVEYYGVDLPRAKLHDARQGNPSASVKRSHTDATDTWLSSRE